MATTTGQHQLTAFTTPVNGTSPIDADEVRTNDATIRTAYNAHDSDTGIHVQSSVIGSRPAAGTSGRKWLTVDALSAPTSVRAFYDDGTNWYELSYLSTAGGTVSGNLSVTGNVGAGGTGIFGDSLSCVNSLTVSRVSTEVDIYLTRTGTDALIVYLYNAGTSAGFYDGTNARAPWVYEPSPNRVTVNSALVAGSTLAVTGAITASSTINGQTISASAALTGTLSVAGIVTLTGSRLNVQGALAEVVTSPTDGAYTGSAYQSIVSRAASTAFDHFYATSNSVIVSRIRGDGSALFSGTVTVSAGGAAITGNSTVTGTLTATATNETRVIRGELTSSASAAATRTSLIGIINVTHTSGTLDGCIGVSSVVQGSGSGGTTTFLAGISSSVSPGTSTVTAAYGAFISVSGSATTVDQYGVYISAAGSPSGVNYALYTAAGRINFQGLPTSSAGLATGTLWNDSGTIKVA